MSHACYDLCQFKLYKVFKTPRELCKSNNTNKFNYNFSFVYTSMSFKVPSWELLTNPNNRIVLWVNNLYPIKVHKLDFRSVLFYIPINAKLTSIFPKHYNVVSIEKRIKEGGAYIHVEIPESMSEQTAFEEINAVFRVSKKYFHFASRPARVELVRGQPLVEDMDSRIPSDLIKVVPKDASTTLDADEIYRLFRKYGKLYDINKKVEEKSHQILIFYDRLEGAIAARNCLHKFSLPSSPNAIISVEYVEVQRMGWLKEQASKNPRLAFPFIGLLATLISMLLFEPIREWFIERELKLPFIKLSFISELLHFGTSCPREEEALIRSHLFSPPRAITVFSAPTGTGKSALVNTILHGKNNVIRIDFSELDSIPDADFINYNVGYYPTLTWIAQISGWMDVILSPLGLSKGNFAWSAHSQLVDILHCLEGALCEVAQNAIDDPMPEWPIIVLDGILENIQSMENKKEADLLLDVFTEFAVTVVQKRGLAHVVIISSDPSAFQTCHKLVVANGGSKIKTFTLDDVSSEKALKFVETSLIALPTPVDERDIAYAVSKVGGRVADLENFTQKVMNGIHPKDAIAILIKRAINQIRIDGFGFSPGNYSKTKENTRKWTQAQLWKVITKIAAEEVVFYDDLLVNIFGGNVEALTGLFNLNLLRVTDNRVLAYSPLYRSAFQEMVANTSIRVPMEITVLRESLSNQVTNLGKIQDELVKWKAIKPFNFNATSFWNLFYSGQTPREKELQKQIISATKKIDETNAKLNELYAIDLKENKKEQI